MEYLVLRGATHLGAAIGNAVGVGVDSLTVFTDQGVFTAGLNAEGCQLGTKVGTRLTTRPEQNPDIIRFYGGPISALVF